MIHQLCAHPAQEHDDNNLQPMDTLPEFAFIPRRRLNATERQRFLERRNQLFSSCTPEEQACLIKLARWYEAKRPLLPNSPNIFSNSFLAVFQFRYAPLLHKKPNLAAQVLAKLWSIATEFDKRYRERLRHSFVAQLQSMLDSGQGNVLIGATAFLRALPFELGYDAQRAFEQQLDDITAKCTSSKANSAGTRMSEVLRVLQTCKDRETTQRFSVLIWPLLLDLAREDLGAAIRVVDQFWQPRRFSAILGSLYLHEAPALAYQLAVIFKLRRPDFASEMLCESIERSSWQLKKLDAAGIAALEAIMDASCELLASWTLAAPSEDKSTTLRCLQTLLQFGDPAAAYWDAAQSGALDNFSLPDRARQREQLKLIAQVAVYADSGSARQAEAFAAFKACAAEALAGLDSWEGRLADAAVHVCNSMSILENKVLSYRNRRIDAQPTHALLGIAEEYFNKVLAHLATTEPDDALGNFALLSVSLSNEILVRKHHDAFRAMFEENAKRNPGDAGKALKHIIRYSRYTHTDDEMYRSRICKESAELLLPVLETISPADAEIARSALTPGEHDWF